MSMHANGEAEAKLQRHLKDENASTTIDLSKPDVPAELLPAHDDPDFWKKVDTLMAKARHGRSLNLLSLRICLYKHRGHVGLYGCWDCDTGKVYSLARHHLNNEVSSLRYTMGGSLPEHYRSNRNNIRSGVELTLAKYDSLDGRQLKDRCCMFDTCEIDYYELKDCKLNDKISSWRFDDTNYCSQYFRHSRC